MQTRGVAAWVLLATAAQCIPAYALSAQRYVPLASLAPGDTLRVWSSQPRLDGTVGVLTRLPRDTISLADLPRRRAAPMPSPRIELPVGAADRVQVRRGNHRSIVGGVAGLVIGGAAGLYGGVALGLKVACGRGWQHLGGRCTSTGGD